MKKIILLLVLLYSFQQLCIAQNHAIDSLTAVLKTLPNDTNKVNTQIHLCEEYMDLEDYDKSNQYANDAIALADKIKFIKGKANATYDLGSNAFNSGNTLEAVKYDSLAAIMYKEIGYIRNQAACIKSIGLIYYSQSKFENSLKYYFEGIKLDESIDNRRGIANAKNVVGIIFQYQGAFSQSLKYAYESLKIRESFNDKHNMALCYNNIGNVYSSLDKDEDALKNYELALKIFTDEEDKNNIATSKVNIGNIYKHQNKNPEALKYLNEGRLVLEELKNKRSLETTIANIGQVQTQAGDLDKATKSLEQALQLATELKANINLANVNMLIAYLNIKKSEKATSPDEKEKYNVIADEHLQKLFYYAKEANSLSGKSDAYELSIELDSIRGDFKKAFEDHKRFMDCKIKMLEEDNVKKTDLLKMQYELGIKEPEPKVEEEKKK